MRRPSTSFGFCRNLHHHYGRRVVLIWDRYAVHRAATAFFAEHHPDWFTFEWLPTYSPQLNPVEQSSALSELMEYVRLPMSGVVGPSR